MTRPFRPILRAALAVPFAAACAVALAQAGAIDTTPPVLHHIDVTGSVDARAVHQSVDAVLDMTDDLSGVIRVGMDFRSPSGMQHVTRIFEPPAPARKLNGPITMGLAPFTDTPFTEFSEPGTWEAVLLYAYDANGNFAGYSQHELRALGTTTFVVRNERYDIVPPSLVGGTIATPRVHLSKPPKGTAAGTLPYASAKVAMTDAGNGAVSGVYSGRLIFCADDCAHSFVLEGVAPRAGRASDTLTIGAQLGPQQHPGTYQIFALVLLDAAGNEADYTSSAFGGETDFGEFFPDGVTVSIEP
jgi:hypothetical protein